MGKYLCQCFLFPPDDKPKEVLVVTGACSRTPIVFHVFLFYASS